MKSTSETGHSKNVANFNKLIMSCESQNGRYNPSNPQLSLENMRKLYAGSDIAVLAVNEVAPLFTTAANAREKVFLGVPGLATKVFNSAKSAGIDKQTVANLLTIKRKLQGSRAKPKASKEKKATLKAEGKEIKEASASQRSFDNQINHFDMLIKAVAVIPEYKPNEEELKIDSLNKTLAIMRDSNNAAEKAFNPLLAARTQRNTLMYTAKTGLVDVALTAKAYIRSVDTVKGAWYKQISGLKFTRI